MAIDAVAVLSDGLWTEGGGITQILEGLDISLDEVEPFEVFLEEVDPLEVTLEADEITVEID